MFALQLLFFSIVSAPFLLCRIRGLIVRSNPDSDTPPELAYAGEKKTNVVANEGKVDQMNPADANVQATLVTIANSGGPPLPTVGTLST